MGTTESLFYEAEDRTSPSGGYTPSSSRQASPSVSSHGGAVPTSSSTGSPPNRQRPPPIQGRRPSPRAPREDVFLLRGIVVGLSHTGKATLLHRLQGKEPDFDAPKRDTTDSKSAESASSNTVDAPYMAPPQATTFDKHIRLSVVASRKLPKTASPPPDFVVILVDPRRSPQKTQKHLVKTLQTVVQLQSGRPLCLCLLRNFRDLEEAGTVPESDLTTWTMQALQDMGEKTYLDSNTMLLQCFDTSLLNCYGLSNLHYFIYQCYLARKQYTLRLLLSQLSRQSTAARESAPPPLDYDDFCDRLPRRRKDDETTVTTVSTHSRRKIIFTRKRHESDDESSSTLPSIQESVGGGDASLGNGAQNISASNALEAFLESDDDSEQDIKPPSLPNDSDDDDEEFMIHQVVADVSDTAKSIESAGVRVQSDTGPAAVASEAKEKIVNQRGITENNADDGTEKAIVAQEEDKGDHIKVATKSANSSKRDKTSSTPVTSTFVEMTDTRTVDKATDEPSTPEPDNHSMEQHDIPGKAPPLQSDDEDSDDEFIIESTADHRPGPANDESTGVTVADPDDRSLSEESDPQLPPVKPPATSDVKNQPELSTGLSDAARAAIAAAQADLERKVVPEKKSKKIKKEKKTKKKKASKSDATGSTNTG